ncbi:MAG: hypothetical protein U0736_14020 [Gemmataceae bacterium]
MQVLAQSGVRHDEPPAVEDIVVDQRAEELPRSMNASGRMTICSTVSM